VLGRDDMLESELALIVLWHVLPHNPGRLRYGHRAFPLARMCGAASTD
jgi:hypothetical protein